MKTEQFFPQNLIFTNIEEPSRPVVMVLFDVMCLCFSADHYVHEVIIKETTTTGRPTASSATKELDDLMASLSDFKVCQHVWFYASHDSNI